MLITLVFTHYSLAPLNRSSTLTVFFSEVCHLNVMTKETPKPTILQG